MKKLLYLLPVLLIILCATPFALYKDTVKPGASLDSPNPSYWKVSLNISASGTLTELDSSSTAPTSTAYTDDATFKGFPLGAYFSGSSSTNSANSSSSSQVSGWSWLWSLVDLAIIAASLFLAIRLNHKKT